MALNPQIIKSYAVKDFNYMHQLIFQGAKYSFFLLFILSLPIILEAETILKLWLKTVPEYTIIFTQLVIINILIDSISGPLMTAAQASGMIKLYQGVVGGLLILNLPVSYLFLKFGFSPEITL
jgi:O-antigen/teichoic acid export membrane protein